MKILAVTVWTLAAVASAMAVNLKNKDVLKDITAYGYLRKIGVPLAARMRKAEEDMDQIPYRIVGGEYSHIEYFSYQVALIVATAYGDAICGGSLLNSRRVLTAGHCWNDGQSQADSFTVILGTSRLYGHDGTKMETSHVITHPKFSPPVTNDIAMIILPHSVEYSSTISPIALPSGDELTNSFVGWHVVASGFGYTRDGESTDTEKFLSYVHLPVIPFRECYPFEDINPAIYICTSGAGRKGSCQGDSGGPIVVHSKKRLVLVGVVSFGSKSGCQKGFPSVFTRVTSYMSWINQLL